MAFGVAILVNGSVDNDLTAAATVEIDERAGQPTRYRLHFPLTISGGDLPLLTDDRIGPGAQLAVVAETDSARACLVWGPVTGQHASLVHGGTNSTLVVEGADASVMMGREDRAEVWADVSDSDVVSTVAGRHGFTSDAQDTSTVHDEDVHALVQRESDLDLLHRLARRNGYLAWLRSTEQGQHTLSFRTPPLDGRPDAELTINRSPQDGPPSVEVVDIWWDIERPTSTIAADLDGRAKEAIDVTASSSSLPTLGSTPFSAVVGDGNRSVRLDAAADDSADLSARANAALAEAAFFVRASGTTTAAALGTYLRAPSLVTLRGAGSRHSGPWLCTRVVHVVSDDSHTMQFELARNGWGST